MDARVLSRRVLMAEPASRNSKSTSCGIVSATLPKRLSAGFDEWSQINKIERLVGPYLRASLTFSARFRSANPGGAERLHCRFSIGSVAVLTSVASLPLVKVYAPEPRDFARNGLVDAPDMPSFKEDDVAFRDSIGIAL